MRCFEAGALATGCRTHRRQRRPSRTRSSAPTKTCSRATSGRRRGRSALRHRPGHADEHGLPPTWATSPRCCPPFTPTSASTRCPRSTISWSSPQPPSSAAAETAIAHGATRAGVARWSTPPQRPFVIGCSRERCTHRARSARRPGRTRRRLLRSAHGARTGELPHQRGADLTSQRPRRRAGSGEAGSRGGQSATRTTRRPTIAEAIVAACVEIRGGALHDQFVVDVIQGGAGTSTNMNANEVIANRALEILGRAARRLPRHPSARTRQPCAEHQRRLPDRGEGRPRDRDRRSLAKALRRLVDALRGEVRRSSATY